MPQTLTPFLLRVCRSVDALRRVILLLVLAAFSAPATHAAESSGVRRYQLGAGDAEHTLRQFVEQSGEQVVYVVTKIRGVTTNPLAGEFTAREALNRLVARTSLLVVEDAKSGALMVNRAGNDESSAAKSTQAPTTGKNPQESPMKKQKVFSVVGAWLALAFPPAHPAHAADGSATSAHAFASISGRVQNVVTGQYLNNVRVSVRGTDLVAFTDQTGTYRLPAVPSGNIALEVFYTGLDSVTATVQLAPGEALARDFQLTSAGRYGATGDVMKLDPFLVASEREADNQALALNEQRFAPNLKNVMAADSFGDVLGSSVGEFLKFLPGIALEEDGNEVQGVSIRGAGGSRTTYLTDGSPIATANDGASRNTDIVMLALDAVSRLEVTKVPMPSSPADSLSGTVNMVSKSAFERSKPQFNYGINLIANGDHLHLRKTPQSVDDSRDYKTRPGVNFSYTLPIRKTFGIVVSGLHSDKYSDTAIATKVFNSGGTQTGASLAQPFLQQFTLNHSPKNLTRTSFTFKADWRVTPHSVLSLSLQRNRSTSNQGNNTWVFNAGTTGTSAVTGGVPLTFGANSTQGATGRGAVTLTSATTVRERAIDSANLIYRYDDGLWKIDAGVNGADSERTRVPNVFSAMSATLSAAPAIRVALTSVDDVRPGNVQVFDNSERPIDIYDLNNYRLNTATQLVKDVNRSEVRSGNFNVKRRLALFPFPAAVQAGGFQKKTTVDSRPETRPLAYAGPDGNASTPDPVAPFAAQAFRGQDDHYDFRGAPWYSAHRAWNAYAANPTLFVQTPAQAVTQATNTISTSERIEETVTAGYFQSEAKLLHNRLNVLAGVRFERTLDRAEGPVFDPGAVFVRNPDGTFARNAAGARIRRPESGPAGSIEELRLTRQERGYKAERAYDGYYPSLHLTYNLKENLLLRAAYARTFSRPAFGDIIPNTTINESDLTEQDISANPDLIRGTLTVRNPALKPWTADNFDFSAEYYTQNGGIVSGGVFVKDIKDFFGTGVRLATATDLEELGLSSQYLQWNLNTKFNAGDARISGAEFDTRQSLRALGRWGQHFTFFANGTYLRLEGGPRADFTSFTPRSANWGLTFHRKRIVASARWNYRGEIKRDATPAAGPDAFSYYPASTRLDLSVSYQLSRRLTFVGSVNNLSNVPERTLQYGSATPEYAKYTVFKEYGIAVGIGVKGTF